MLGDTSKSQALFLALLSGITPGYILGDHMGVLRIESWLAACKVLYQLSYHTNLYFPNFILSFHLFDWNVFELVFRIQIILE